MTENNPQRTIDCIGDSLTVGVQPPSYPKILKELLDENGVEKIRVANRGKEGFTVGEYLDFQQEEMNLKTLKNRQVDHFLILLGTNDTRSTKQTPLKQFKQQYAQLIDLLLQHQPNARAALLTIPHYYAPLTIHWRGEDHLFDAADRIAQELNPAVEELAETYGLDVIDIHTPLLQAGKTALLDGVHPSPQGNRIIAETCLEHLLPALKG